MNSFRGRAKDEVCKPVQNIVKLEWTQVKETSPAVLWRVQIGHGGTQTHL